MREAVLRYTREVAFAAAEVYARAAEARGAWDARLEALVVDAVLRGEADESMQSRAAALGWGRPRRCGGGRLHPARGHGPGGRRPAPRGPAHRRRAARRGPRAADHLHRRQRHRPDGPATAARPALRRRARWWSARSCRTSSPPVAAPGPRSPGTAPRRLAGGTAPGARRRPARRAGPARRPARPAARSIARIVRPLAESPGGTLLDTAAAFLDGALGVEGTARALIVHPNTVRYRLAGITKTIGYDLSDAHDAQTVRIALAFHRLGPVIAVHRAALTGTRPVLVWRKPTESGRKGSSPFVTRWSRSAGQGGTRDRHRLPRPGLPDPGLPRPVARAARPA